MNTNLKAKIMKRTIAIFAFVAICVMQVCAQISVEGYSLVYSSETPERAAALLDLSSEELANCTGDFTSAESMERNWNYCNKASSDWNKRMGTTDEERALVHKFENGHLRLLAKTTDGTVNGFLTGGIRMKNGYKYGIIEVKAKCTPHASNFPAIWMMPTSNEGWPTCGEIDIMELVGNSSTVWSTVHVAARYSESQGGHPVGKTYSYYNTLNPTGSASGYHIYSLYWDKLSLIFYCDGKQVFRYNKDTTLDIENHPNYEKWQFPYNKEFQIILNQALGKSAGWGGENPDPSFTYEMDVEYVRIWQTPQTYDIDKYYLLKNYSAPTRYMAVAEDNTLSTTEATSIRQLNGNNIFGIAPADIHGYYHLVSYSGLTVGNMPDINKAVPMAKDPCYFYLLKDDTKGMAFDYAQETAPTTYGDGSRALTLNANKGNIVSISGNSKNAAWWILEDATDVITGIGDVENEKMRRGENEKIYNLAGQRLSRLQKGMNIVEGRKIIVK